MASRRKLSSAQREYGEDHPTCCICTDRYKKTKILACAHSFCEACLKEYYEGRFINAPTIPCPLCQREIELPEEGIKGLIPNFQLIGMVEDFTLQEEIAFSDGIGPTCDIGLCNKKEALHHCFDCVKNICNECLKNHEKCAGMKSHRVATLEDIRQVKVKVKKSAEDGDSKCHKHKGELMRFFCVSCGVQICQVCMALKHCRPEHHYIDTGEAVEKYKLSMNDKITAVGRNIEHLQQTLHDVTGMKNERSSMVHKAKADVQDRAAEIVAKVKDEEKRLLDKIDNGWQRYSTSLEERAEAVQSVLKREQDSLQTAEEITNAASDSDFLSLNPIISKDLESLTSQNPSELTAKMPTWRLTFDKAEEMPAINLGTLTEGSDEKVWKLRQEVCKIGSEQLHWVLGIAHSPKQDEIAFTDQEKRQIGVFSTDGVYKWSISLDSDPWGVAFIHDQIVIIGETNHVTIYIPRWNMAPTFQIKDASVRILSFLGKMDGNIVAGDVRGMVLTEYRPTDWAITRTIPVQTRPDFIAVAGNDRFALSDFHSGEVAVVDGKGVTLFKIQPCIEGQRANTCSGVCVCVSGLYVAVPGNDKGSGHIHRYDHENGKFLGCVLQGLYEPEGITITEDGQKLIVADLKSVKFFHLE